VPRSATFLFALASLALFGFGVVADRALRGQADRAKAAAAQAGDETARLAARAVRAALAQIEEGVLRRDRSPGIVTEHLAISPGRSIADARTTPYARRSRAELAALLRSTHATANGIPEAVVARLALGRASPVTAESESAPPDVAELLLGGALPVRPEDLPLLARALGAGADARVPRLQQRLREAPEAARLPASPEFRRAFELDRVEGWTRMADSPMRVRYEVLVAKLLAAAHAPEGARAVDARGAAPGAIARVPDVDDLSVAVPIRTGEALRVQLLRGALWLALAVSALSLAAVERARAAEGRATQREKAFLASVTHELRTPLAAIRLLGERLAEGRGDPPEYGALMAEEALRLDALVERVLAATRAGERPSFGPVDPGDLVRSAVRVIAPRAERRRVTLVCRADRPLPTATWDGESVRHALLNLLDNAVKHGREGGRVEAHAETEGSAVSFHVRDDGPGIGRREREGVFQRFVRGTTDAPGTGLGLHLVEEVARAHGGRVDLKTAEGQGCTFTLRLPLVPPGAVAAAGRTG
jgi:signal transduction histidine kinase